MEQGGPAIHSDKPRLEIGQQRFGRLTFLLRRLGEKMFGSRELGHCLLCCTDFSGTKTIKTNCISCAAGDTDCFTSPDSRLVFLDVCTVHPNARESVAGGSGGLINGRPAQPRTHRVTSCWLVVGVFPINLQRK